MAWPMPWPCCGPHWSVRKISISNVPCRNSIRFWYGSFLAIRVVDQLLPIGRSWSTSVSGAFVRWILNNASGLQNLGEESDSLFRCRYYTRLLLSRNPLPVSGYKPVTPVAQTARYRIRDQCQPAPPADVSGYSQGRLRLGFDGAAFNPQHGLDGFKPEMFSNRHPQVRSAGDETKIMPLLMRQHKLH